MTREKILAKTFVELADSLVAEFDVIDLLIMLADRCVELFDVTEAGIMLATPDGELRVIASSSETMRSLELFELQAREGPCLDCFTTRRPVLNRNLDRDDGRWPRFGDKARDAGIHSVHALPLRLRDTVIGALNLFRPDPGELDDADVHAAQALADAATIAILQHRAVIETRVVNEQLQQALDSRVVIEQAKGILSERAGTEMDQAFAMLRHYARTNNLGLASVAGSLIDGSLDTAALLANRPTAV
ncbi:MAG: GAF domain-containing protein [Microthrixaceae bacterium]